MAEPVEQPQTWTVAFQPIGKRVEVETGHSLFAATRQAGIELASACGGEGKCGLCRVTPTAGDTGPVTPEEQFLLTETELAAGTRLACRTQVSGDGQVQVPRRSLLTGQRLQIAADLRPVEPDPLVWALPVEVNPPTLEDSRSDLSRLIDRITSQHGIDEVEASPPVVRQAADALRANNWRVTAFIGDNHLIGLAPPATRPLGLAVDLGTTKIAAYLVDLGQGHAIAAAGSPNPQISYGEDVISRLNHVYANPERGDELAAAASKAIDDLLTRLLAEAKADRAQVVDACVVGNTAMIHLLLAYPVAQLVKSPFVPAVSAPTEVPAADLGLGLAAGAQVHIPPVIGGFVGADHVAMALATGLDERRQVAIGVDIGTNTEIVLRHPGRETLTATSCASGPAFEGAHIGYGMRAASGAIEKVRIHPDGTSDLVTIDHTPAVGLCGSGILDAVAQLYLGGFVNHRGRLQRHRPGVAMGPHEPEFVLVEGPDSGTGQPITITQHDLNEIQLAKGAIHAGVEALLESTGTEPGEVAEVVIAGAFGSFLNLQSAIDIGLLPPLPNAQFCQVGNAAVVGAQWMLASATARRRARHIAARCDYLELTTHPGFSRRFAYGMLFPVEAEQKPAHQLVNHSRTESA